MRVKDVLSSQDIGTTLLIEGRYGTVPGRRFLADRVDSAENDFNEFIEFAQDSVLPDVRNIEARSGGMYGGYGSYISTDFVRASGVLCLPDSRSPFKKAVGQLRWVEITREHVVERGRVINGQRIVFRLSFLEKIENMPIGTPLEVFKHSPSANCAGSRTISAFLHTQHHRGTQRFLMPSPDDLKSEASRLTIDMPQEKWILTRILAWVQEENNTSTLPVIITGNFVPATGMTPAKMTEIKAIHCLINTHPYDYLILEWD